MVDELVLVRYPKRGLEQRWIILFQKNQLNLPRKL